MAHTQKGDRLWLALCNVSSIVVDVTLNKYSNLLPKVAVLCLWAIPTCLFVVWTFRAEATKNWWRTRFLKHRASYILMFLILIPFSWLGTSAMIVRLASHIHSVSPQPAPLSALAISSQETSPSPKSKAATPQVPALPRKENSQQPIAYSQQSPTYEQQCKDSACAQGPGAQATINQYGPPPAQVTVNEIVMIPLKESKDGFMVTRFVISTDKPVALEPVGMLFSGPCEPYFTSYVDLDGIGAVMVTGAPGFQNTSASNLFSPNGMKIPNEIGFFPPALLTNSMHILVNVKSAYPVHFVKFIQVKLPPETSTQ